MIIMILIYTAQRLAGYTIFEKGAGELNVEGAIRLTKIIRTDLTNTTLLGTPSLITNALPSPYLQ